MDNKEKQFSMSWFFRWFLDNKAITVFLVTLLLGLNLLVLSKITFIFIPIFEFAGAVMLPVIISGLLYYLLNPIVDFLERKGLKRNFCDFLSLFLDCSAFNLGSSCSDSIRPTTSGEFLS